MKIPLPIQHTRPAAPIRLCHVALAILIPLAACAFAYLLTLAILCQ